MFLTSFQIFLIISLIVVFPLGLWNQKRMIKKREFSMENYHSQRDLNSLSQDEKNARQYILEYKTQYSKESLKKALINSGASEKQIDSWLIKYYN